MNNFFSKEENIKTLTSLKKAAQDYSPQNGFQKWRTEQIHTTIKFITNQPSEWDKYCQISIKDSGEKFLNTITQNIETEQSWDLICAYCFIFSEELYISYDDDISPDITNFLHYSKKYIEKFSEDSKRIIEFGSISLPTKVLKKILLDENIKNIRDIAKFTQSAEHSKKEWEDTAKNFKRRWESELGERESRADQLKNALETYKEGFNFVGLHEGFSHLSEQKSKEKYWLSVWLKTLGFLTVIPIIAEISLIWYYINDFEKVKDALLISAIPVTSVVAISLYYFRVLLSNHKSINSQILQIELRKTLCRFIQSYSDYSKDIKTNDKDALSKFENIIFSSIVADEGKIPATFDGADQLGALIKSIKS